MIGSSAAVVINNMRTHPESLGSAIVAAVAILVAVVIAWELKNELKKRQDDEH